MVLVKVSEEEMSCDVAWAGLIAELDELNPSSRSKHRRCLVRRPRGAMALVLGCVASHQPSEHTHTHTHTHTHNDCSNTEVISLRVACMRKVLLQKL